MAIHSEGIDWLVTKLKNELSHGIITVDGSEVVLSIYKLNVSGSTIQIMLYADETVTGLIIKEQLIMKTGAVFMEKTVSEDKTSEEGLLIVFELTIEEVEA